MNITTKLKRENTSMSLVNNLIVWVLGVLLFLLPSNLGKHFVDNTSYINGVLVDYLIPTVYLTDFLTVFLIMAIFIKSFYLPTASVKRLHLMWLFLGLFVGSQFLSTLFLPTTSSMYKLVRVILYVVLTLVISQVSFHKQVTVFLGRFLSFTVIFQSLLALYQLIFQRSLLGYYFLGEVTISKLSFGITKDFIDGHYLVLPYGTFPHPNILGGFLAVSITILSYLFLVTSRRQFLLALLLGFLTLLLTKSDIALIAGTLGLGSVWGYYVSRPHFLTAYFSASFWQLPSVWRRVNLGSYSLKMIADHPLRGVGVNNFISSLSDYGYNPGFPAFWQPVHNIFLLIASESGIPALLSFLVILIYIWRRLLVTRNFLLALVILQLVLLGMFDHYLWTTSQGLLMLWLTLGVALSRIKTAHDK